MNTIGIPQGLHYHEFGSFWKHYFDSAGVETVVSAPTTKSILNTGTNLAVDESCLPLKIYLGHVSSLLDTCSHIFVPRISHYHENYYFCAKFAGLPDIVRNTFNLPADRLIAPDIDGFSLSKNFKECCSISKKLSISPLKSYLACQQAKYSFRKDIQFQPSDESSMIAVIGHSYLLKDPFLNADILSVFATRKMQPVFPDQIPAKILYSLAAQHHPEIYWQLSAKIAGAVDFFANHSGIKGILLLSSFGCGPDSLINEYLDYHILSKSNIPYTFIIFDEHTGNAGILTRLEAFLDLVEWRRLP